MTESGFSNVMGSGASHAVDALARAREPRREAVTGRFGSKALSSALVGEAQQSRTFHLPIHYTRRTLAKWGGA